jgi:MerR family transcriptional regulator, light-induced transcriptional regulator
MAPRDDRPLTATLLDTRLRSHRRPRRTAAVEVGRIVHMLSSTNHRHSGTRHIFSRMPKRAPRPAILHPIQVVTRRTGVSADVLRVWEKRYAVVTPMRSTSGRRLYSDADIERLRLMVQATRTGRTIGQVAALTTASLVDLLDEKVTPQHPSLRRGGAAAAPPSPPAAGDLFEACIAAIARFDAVTLDLLLRRAVVALSADDFLDAIVVPMVDRLRVQLLDGSLRGSQGHLAHAVLRRVLDHIVATATAPLASRDVVVTTLGGHVHEIDALIVAAATAADGWRVTYVGPRVPAEDVADTLEHIDAHVLILSLAPPAGDREIPRELRRLRALLPAHVELLVVGSTPDVHRSSIVDTGATPLVGLGALRARLRELRDSAPRASRPRASSRRRSAP